MSMSSHIILSLIPLLLFSEEHFRPQSRLILRNCAIIRVYDGSNS